MKIIYCCKSLYCISLNKEFLPQLINIVERLSQDHVEKLTQDVSASKDLEMMEQLKQKIAALKGALLKDSDLAPMSAELNLKEKIVTQTLRGSGLVFGWAIFVGGIAIKVFVPCGVGVGTCLCVSCCCINRFRG